MILIVSQGRRIRRRTYKTREAAKQDVFDYIEIFYNTKRKNARNGMLSPAEFERQQEIQNKAVKKSRGYSIRVICAAGCVIIIREQPVQTLNSPSRNGLLRFSYQNHEAV